MGRADEHRGAGNAAAPGDLGADLLHKSPRDEEEVDAHEGDARPAVVEDRSAHLARVVERAVETFPVAAGCLHADVGRDVALGEAGLEAARRGGGGRSRGNV